MLRTLNGPVHPFFSQKIRTSLPKFRANGSVCIMSGLLQVLSASCTPRYTCNLYSSLIVLAMILACCYCEGEGGKFITMRG